MFTRCLAALAALVCNSAAAPDTIPDAPIPYYPQIHQVSCDLGKGSAVRIGDDTYVTAAHVSKLSGCSIDGEPLQVVNQSGELDFTILHSNAHGRGLKINCGGFVPGDFYYATGFAHGWPIQTTILLRATAFKGWHGFTILYGPQTVIPGQSGGAVMNAAGELVGIVNAYNSALGLSFSRPLSETVLCQR
jgi:hypothetical protein